MNIKLETRFRNQHLYLLILLVLFISIFIIYFPSINHVHRADQWNYLLDTIGERDFLRLVQNTYSYSRTRIIGPGDTALFRPVLFILLSLQKSLFGASGFKLSQVVSIFLHITITFLLFELMRQIAKISKRTKVSTPTEKECNTLSIGIYLFIGVLCLFFSTNFAIQEMVIWNHINAYLMFYILTFCAILISLNLLESFNWLTLQKRLRVISCIYIITLISAFTYELGQVLAILLAITLGFGIYRIRGNRILGLSSAFTFTSIPVIYQVCNKLDLWIHQGKYVKDFASGKLIKALFNQTTLEHVSRFVNFTLIQPLFPSLAKVSFPIRDQRLIIMEPSFQVTTNMFYPLALLSIIALGIWIILFSTSILYLIRSKERIIPLTFFLILGLLVSYTSIIVLGRMNLRPGNFILSSNSYYTYFSLVLFILLSFIVWVNALYKVQSTFRGILIILVTILSLILLTLSVYNGFKVFGLNRTISENYENVRMLSSEVNYFIDKNRSENFSIAFDISRFKPFPPAVGGVPITSILFREYENNYAPNYVVYFQNSHLVTQTIETYRNFHEISDKPLFPELVELNSPYNIFYFKEKFWGIHKKDYYNLVQGKGDYLIQGESLEKLKRNLSYLRNGYQSFNIISLDEEYYAIPKGEGGFHLERIKSLDYSKSFHSKSFNLMILEIDDYLRTP